MRLLLLLATGVLILAFRVFSVEIGLSGQLVKGSFPADQVAVYNDGQMVNKGSIKGSGRFNIDFSDDGQGNSFDFYIFTKRHDSVLVASIAAFNTDEPKVVFQMPKQVTGKKIPCPKCTKVDRVYQLVYPANPPRDFKPSAKRYFCKADGSVF